ncbi:MAG: peptidylprolyl isomerase [Proteobacteria bacterium]|nr:peptidylprolyl isomerase [Pseudomonadota bacterium]MDA1355181.1 peptidylprolyl isomerase [Pseudomonadota bacterium]
MLNRVKISYTRAVLGAALLLAATISLLLPPQNLARAQDIMRIAAVVNDDVISLYDLAARINIVVASSNLRDAPELRRQIAPQVLRTLVDEYLQTQEAARLDISATDRDIEFTINQIEQKLGTGEGGFDNFVRANRLDREALIAQLKAEIAWTKLISRRLSSAISVGEDEIDGALSRLESSRGQPEYRVAEIFLSIESTDQEREITDTAENLLAQLRQGVAFPEIARQFSQSATSAVGGDIGWVIEGQLPAEIDAILSAMAPGDISSLVRTFDGVHIIKLIDRRTVLTANPLDARLHLAQLIVEDFGTDRETVLDRIRQSHAQSEDCADMLRLTADFTSSQSGDLGELGLRDMPTDLRDAVLNVQAMELSPPLPFGRGFRILMVCSRVEAEVELPTRDTMRRDISNRRLELQARRYLRDLRRSAFVDFRV